MSEGAKLPSQFPPDNKADEQDEDDNDNGGDKALLIHPVEKNRERGREESIQIHLTSAFRPRTARHER